MVPAADEGEDLERTAASTPWTGGTSAPPPTATPPTGSRTRSRSRPPRAAPRPGWPWTRPARPVVDADLHLAGRRQARHARHRRPAQRRPGPLPAPDGRPGGPPRRLRDPGATPSTPGTWSTAASARSTAAAPRPGRASGSGHPSRSTPPSSDRATWDAAQQIGAERGNSRDAETPTARPRPALRPAVPGPVPGLPAPHVRHRPARPRGGTNTYYRCPHDPANPRHAAAHPDHPRTVMLREDTLHRRHRQLLRPARLRPRPRRPARRPAPRHRPPSTPRPAPARKRTCAPSWPASTPPSTA